jgi:hypothetical protein
MAALKGNSSDPNIPAVRGSHSQNSSGVEGKSKIGPGVHGISEGIDPDQQGIGVWGQAIGTAVMGQSQKWMGVFGSTESADGAFGVMGVATQGGAGVAGEGTFRGVLGTSTKTEAFDPAGIGVHGISTAAANGIGVLGEGGDTGVLGRSASGQGVTAESTGSEPTLLVKSPGSFSAIMIFGNHGERYITCRGPNNNDVFIVTNSGDAEVRGAALTCDRNAKANLTSVDAQQILEKLACLPIQNWSYKADPASVRHIGPTSQDFQAAFGLNGDDDVHISAVDAQGIALAAIQGLNEKLQAENNQLRSNLASLEVRLAALESKA